MLENPKSLRYSTGMSDDPFSTILKFTNSETVVSGGFSAGGRWAVRFPEMDKIKFSAVVRGNCWLLIDGQIAPIRAETGDVFLLSGQQAFVLASELESEPIQAASLFHDAGPRIANLGEGDDFFQIGGFVRVDPISGGLLLDVLPPLIHVKVTSPHAPVLQWLVNQLVRERLSELPGSSLASAQLAQLMLIEIVRAHLETSGRLPAGLLRAAHDPMIAPALRLMHDDPGRVWHLDELAKAVSMSRTTFALHFKLAAGIPPLRYLAQWRMRLAERALREENTPVSLIASRLGYSSISAFSNAFKRFSGKAPKGYRSKIGVSASTSVE
jgi:AraC-like DNA-binding protein